MKKILMTLVAIVIFSITASAQFSLGIKAGANFKKLDFKDDYMSCDMETGFTLGAMGEVSLIKSGLTLDFSLMYSNEYFSPQYVTHYDEIKNYDFDTDYLNIPINLKWKINIPAINKIIKPMIYTGPEISFVLRENIADDLYKRNTIHFCWNIGAGVELFDKWQIAAHYGIGLSECIKKEQQSIYGKEKISAKQQYAVVTVAYMFKM